MTDEAYEIWKDQLWRGTTSWRHVIIVSETDRFVRIKVVHPGTRETWGGKQGSGLTEHYVLEKGARLDNYGRPIAVWWKKKGRLLKEDKNEIYQKFRL